MIPATLVGLGIGDALGAPLESNKDEIHPLLKDWDGNYVSGKNHLWEKMRDLPAGSTTDDTAMSVCLAESLLESFGFSVTNVAEKYLKWADSTPYGMGGTTKLAMDNLREGKSAYNGSGVYFYSEEGSKVGNGTAMRAAPIGMWLNTIDLPKLVYSCRMDSQITHIHLEAIAGSVLVALAVSYCLEENFGQGNKLIHNLIRDCADLKIADTQCYRSLVQVENFLTYPNNIELGHQTKCQQGINYFGRRGNIIQTVSSALMVAGMYINDFELAVTEAVRGGGDTDTRAAIVGAIVGSHVGLEIIPDKYKKGLLDFEKLRKLDEQLVNCRIWKGTDI